MDANDTVETEPFIYTPHGNNKFKQSSRPGARREDVLMTLLCTNGILLLVITACLYYLARVLNSLGDEGVNSCFGDDLLDSPISLQMKTFDTIVNPDIGSVVDTVFPSTLLTNADWDSVVDEGKIWLSEDEVARIPSSNPELYRQGDGYSGNLEVFHELHCLNRIRRGFYGLQVHRGSESKVFRDAHDHHCFHYLWQTLMCHADVSVMSLVWQPENGSETAHFSSTKQCRNFEQIHDWAKARRLDR